MTEELDPVNNIVDFLILIGEDPDREGLVNTPKRIMDSWEEIYSGYRNDPSDVFTTFSSDGYQEIVLLKNIEMFSMCEHHALPFFGKAHIAYIPKDKIVGVSKLARLLEIYSRRLQIQERLCVEVTTALMNYLQPIGAACVIEAEHLCMRMRGVNKQNSILVTSSLVGCFKHDPSTRSELMSLIKGD